MAGCVGDGSIEQASADAVLARFLPHVHAPDQGLVTLLGIALGAEPDDTDQPLRVDRCKNPRLGDPLLEPIQRLVLFILKRRGERLRIPAQALEADIPVSGCVSAGERFDLETSSHAAFLPFMVESRAGQPARLRPGSCDLSCDA